eukprot:6843553-Heterocapsa_arctica.AAC.1
MHSLYRRQVKQLSNSPASRPAGQPARRPAGQRPGSSQPVDTLRVLVVEFPLVRGGHVGGEALEG